MSEIVELIAKRLKDLRLQKTWSLATCADRTGVSKAMLGQIERGESSPTIATLWKIATGMDVSLSSLMAGESPQDAVNASRYTLTHTGIDVRTLLPYDERSRQEVYLLKLQPGAESISTPHRVGTMETLIVISGELDLFLDDQWQSLESNSAFRFYADQKHGYRNSGNQPVIFHNIITYDVM